MRKLFLALLLVLILATIPTAALAIRDGEAGNLRIVATVSDRPLRVISTGCQAVEPNEEGSCYVLFKNFSDAAMVIEAASIETNDAQITQRPTGLSKRIEPGRADGIYWYFVSETTGSVVFDVAIREVENGYSTRD